MTVLVLVAGHAIPYRFDRLDQGPELFAGPLPWTLEQGPFGPD